MGFIQTALEPRGPGLVCVTPHSSPVPDPCEQRRRTCLKVRAGFGEPGDGGLEHNPLIRSRGLCKQWGCEGGVAGHGKYSAFRCLNEEERSKEDS